MPQRSSRTARVGQQAGPAPSRATPAQAGRLVLVDGEGGSRLFIYLMGLLLGRVDRERRNLYFADLDLASVAETVGLAAIEPGMRDAGFRETHRSLRSVVGVEGQRAVNALSIAAATGIPRETVRRKLKFLVERGLIIEQKRGQYVLKPGSVQKPEHLSAYDRAMRDAVRFMNECLHHGLVRWSHRPEQE